MKRNCKNSIENVYEIWTDGIVNENGRKRLEVVVKSMEGFKAQEGYEFTYIMLVSNLRTFLEERQCSHSEMLRVRKYWIVEPNDAKSTSKKVSSAA